MKNPVRIIGICLAFLCLTLGIIGIFVPILPTTPFLLLAAWLLARSSKRLHAWLLNHKILGSYIKDFQEHKALPIHVKVVSVSNLWLTLVCSMVWFSNGKVWLILLLTLTGIAVTWHILSYKTKR